MPSDAAAAAPQAAPQAATIGHRAKLDKIRLALGVELEVVDSAMVASAYEDLKGDLEMPTGTLIKKVQILYAHMDDEGMF